MLPGRAALDEFMKHEDYGDDFPVSGLLLTCASIGSRLRLKTRQ